MATDSTNGSFITFVAKIISKNNLIIIPNRLSSVMRINQLLIFVIAIVILLIPSFLYSQKIDIEPIEKPYFTYYFDSPRYIETSDSVLMTTRQKMIDLLQDSLSYKPSVYLLGNLSQFNSLIDGKFPDWGIGVALPHKKMIVIKSPDNFNLNKSLEQLLAHEYAHLAVSHKAFIANPPRWLNEGVAMYVSMEWSWSDNMAMGKAAVFGQLISLEDIDKVNRFNESKAQVAYAESYLAVRYLLKNYGKNAVSIFLEQINKNRSIEEAIYVTTGATMAEFEIDFEKYLHKQFNFASLFMDTIFFWIALAGVVVYAFFAQYKKRREYYKKWDEEEKLHSTDFDYGDADNPEQIEDDDDEAWRA